VYQRAATTVTVVGSADPFRNDRIGEHGNAALATALLTGAPRLVWLNLHRREPPPLVTDDPGLAGAPAAPPSLRPRRSGDPVERDFPIEGRRGEVERVPPPNIEGDDESDRADPPNPLWVAFPKWVYPTTALLVLATIALAIARARRLGGPVVEPLPVVVRSSETASGRGRLYQRARARPEALQVLRDAALARLTRLLRLEADVEQAALIEAVAASSGWPPAAVGHALFGPPPENDAELVAAATQLEQLVAAVTTEQPGAGADQTQAWGRPPGATTGPPAATGGPPGTSGPADTSGPPGTSGPAGTSGPPGAWGRPPAATTEQPGAQAAPGATVEGEPR
jgi:hypothetical protein